MSTFRGRLQYSWALCNPLGLRWGEHAVVEARATLAAQGSGAAVASDDLRYAQTVMTVSAPQGALAPLPCRTAGWALATAPVMAFMVSNAITHPTSIPRIVIGQWLNQTQNAVITWYNRPHVAHDNRPDGPDGSHSSSDSALANDTNRATAAYCAACAVAIPTAVGSGLLARRSALLRPLAMFAPYPGVALANVLNTCMMRSTDLRQGVPVYAEAKLTNRQADVSMPPSESPLGNPVGLSTVAGRRAVADTAVTRTLIPLANFVVVPLLMVGIDRLRSAARSTGAPPRSLALQVGSPAHLGLGCRPA